MVITGLLALVTRFASTRCFIVMMMATVVAGVSAFDFADTTRFVAR